MPVTDIFCNELHATTGLDKLPIRPLALTVEDKRPFIAIDCMDWRPLRSVNGTIYEYQGKQRVQVVANTYGECKALSILVQNKLNWLRASNAAYRVSTATQEDGEDVLPVMDENDSPAYYARAMLFNFRAKPIT